MIGWILLGAVLVYFAVCLVIAVKALGQVITPVCHDEAYMRGCEAEHHFTAALDAYDTQWDRHPFTLDRGDALISGEYILNPAGCPKAAIICHGHTVNRIADLKYALMFYKLGFHIVLFDQRHFGASTGAISTLGYRETGDLAAVIAYTRSVFGEDCAIALHGESMGAATALMVLDREKPDLVIADCPFMDTEALIKKILRQMRVPANTVALLAELVAKHRYGYDIRAASPIRSVAMSDVPICLIHGDSDGLIPCDHSRKLYARCRNQKSELHVFPGADHACSVILDPKRYETIVREFVEKCGIIN